MSLHLRSSDAEGQADIPPARGRFLEISAAEYHADPCETPSLSSSIAAELITRSPLHAWQVHPRLGMLRRDDTAATSNGTLTHALILGKGEEELAVLDVKDFRTNAAKEARDAALAAGKTVLKKSDFDEAKDIAKILRGRLDDLGIKLDGQSEEKIEWVEETPDGPLFCRAMLDHVVIRFSPHASATVFDLKTCTSADLRSIQRKVVEYSYDIQEAAYRRAVAAVCPEAVGRIDFVFLFAETEPPYAVTPVRLNGTWRLMGGLKWERACRTWARCLKSGNWPSYVDHITQIEAPPWALTEEAILNDANV